MDRGAWWAAVHGVARVGHDLATKERKKERHEKKQSKDKIKCIQSSKIISSKIILFYI